MGLKQYSTSNFKLKNQKNCCNLGKELPAKLKAKKKRWEVRTLTSHWKSKSHMGCAKKFDSLPLNESLKICTLTLIPYCEKLCKYLKMEEFEFVYNKKTCTRVATLDKLKSKIHIPRNCLYSACHKLSFCLELCWIEATMKGFLI